MNTIGAAAGRLLRGPQVSRMLVRFGIDPRRYWLLMDLFGDLAERREMLSQLGRDGVTLKVAAMLYAVMFGLFAVMMVINKPPLAVYFWTFAAITAFLLLSVLLSEAGNSLVNPAESLILAHHPIDGATYTAAKLSHLGRIVLYLVPGLNAVPAMLGLFLRGAGWWYPVVHMLSAFVTGLIAALVSCAIFGWLIRLLPPARVKTVGQVAEAVPFISVIFLQLAKPLYRIGNRLPALPVPGAYLAAGAALVLTVAIVFGIRSLSIDYLVRVTAISQGRSTKKGRVKTSRLSGVVSRLFGSQASRGGFDYVSRLLVRDWQVRRQLLPFIPAVALPLAGALAGVKLNPFSEQLTPAHLVPHAFGFAFFALCTVLPYGTDHKAAWLFLVAPAGAFRGVARGAYASLWIKVAVVPHAILLPVFAWFWGVADAGLFIAYSLAVSAVYLGLTLRLIDGVPFTRQPQTTRNPFSIPVMFAGGIAMAIAVALQHFVVFRSHALVLAATVALAGVAYLATRSSLKALEESMRFNLGLIANESGPLYKEVDA